ncbi:hypothetical protein GQ53DRAFT_687319 [Thozetella sp. PMI_491]|nr:hypothetical protein GQ53DRAFT_687319 [Thozetella sp. PMI_491]
MATESPDSQSLDLAHSSVSPPPAAAKKHCWECLRRRVVCDSWQPVCNRCRHAGIVCPGYDGEKSLKWLPTGKVASRTWKRKKRAPRPVEKEAKPTQTEDALKPGAMALALAVAHRDAPQPKITHILELPDETVEMWEAAAYCNEQLLTQAKRFRLRPSPFIVPFEFYHMLNSSQRHAMVTVAVNHRFFSQIDETGRPKTPELISRLHHHRGRAIRALSWEIEAEQANLRDATIASMLLLMFADNQQPVSGNWRTHAAALSRIFAARGGIRQAARESKLLRPLILGYMMTIIIGNTTTPARDLITIDGQRDILDLFIELYEELRQHILFPCPMPLFVEVVHINELRYQIATANPVADLYPYASEAHAVMGRIAAFSPEQWSQEHERAAMSHEWLILAQLCQSCCYLYCVASLQAVLRSGEALKRKHRTRVISLIGESMRNLRLQWCVLWPLVVVGAQAVMGDSEERDWVNKQLLAASSILGSHSPLVARDMLTRFWRSGKKEWDDCFDQPRVFLG